MTDIHVRSFMGSGIKPHLHSIAKLRAEVLQDFPHWEEPNLHRETEYLKKVASCKESITVLIFDGHTLVGCGSGYPFSLAEPSLIKPFKENHIPVDTYFFLGEVVLLKQYRGRGIGHHLFDAREAHALSLKGFKHLCFCVPFSSTEHVPPDFVSLNDFYRRRGYIQHPDLKYSMMKKCVGEQAPTEQTGTFWIKDI